MKKSAVTSLVILAAVIGAVLLMGFVGLKDAQKLDSTVTFASNFVTNLNSDEGKIAMTVLFFGGMGTLLVPKAVKAIRG